MKTILLQAPIAVDSLGIDLAKTSEPVEKTLSIIELVTSGGLGGQIIMLTLGALSIFDGLLLLGTYSSYPACCKR